MVARNQIVLAAFGQLNRNDEFKIITKIIGAGSKISVRKVAYTGKAASHINRLVANHKKLSDAIASSEKIRLVKMLDTGKDFVEFEYIKGRNVEGETFNYILSGDYDKATNIIDGVLNLIDNLASRRSSAEAKIVERINNVYKLPASSTNFTNPGIVDLNLDNFILDPKGGLVAFDYEWIFDQPVATDFIKTRLLYTFFARRSEAFAFLPSETLPFRAIVGGSSRIFIPGELYARYGKFLTKESLRKYWKAEDIFQSYVNKHHANTATSSYANFVSEEVVSPQLTLPEIEESLRNDYKSLLEHARNLENELSSIKQSTTYRFARKIASVKERLSGKQH